MNFKPKNFLKRDVEKGDVLDAKVAITNYIQEDPANREAIQGALKYVQENMPEFEMEAHDNRKFKPSSEWDDEYFGLLISDLMDNFSYKRFDHILQVGESLYGTGKQRGGAASKQISSSYGIDEAQVASGHRRKPSYSGSATDKRQINRSMGKKTRRKVKTYDSGKKKLQNGLLLVSASAVILMLILIKALKIHWGLAFVLTFLLISGGLTLFSRIKR